MIRRLHERFIRLGKTFCVSCKSISIKFGNKHCLDDKKQCHTCNPAIWHLIALEWDEYMHTRQWEVFLECIVVPNLMISWLEMCFRSKSMKQFLWSSIFWIPLDWLISVLRSSSLRSKVSTDVCRTSSLSSKTSTSSTSDIWINESVHVVLF